MQAITGPVYVLGSSRIPFVKSGTRYAKHSRKELMVGALDGLVQRYGLEQARLGEVALGAVINSVGDFNLARETLLSTRLHPETPGVTLQRACGTGLEASWLVALKVFSGAIDLGIAGGVDTNSDLPIEISPQLRDLLLRARDARSLRDRLALLKDFRPAHLIPRIPSVDEPRTHLSMGQHCELMVKEWNIERRAQDELALMSHQRAAHGYDSGFFTELITPFAGLSRDGILRPDTSLEKLARLAPAFNPQGSLTAGNSTALTDGAASVLIGSDAGAERIGARPLARLVDFASAAVDFPHGAGLLMAPTQAVATLLARQRLSFADFDYIEIHEAFAGQVLCNLKAWEDPAYCRDVLKLSQPLGPIDRSRLNVMGSSLALGHPFAATGARIVGSLAKLLSEGGSKRGLISICTAGGMGMAALLESA